MPPEHQKDNAGHATSS